MPYEVKDIALAEDGRKNIEWAESQMRALLKVRERFEKEKPLKGHRIGMALHVTKETAVLVRTFIAGGAQVAITSCNPLSTQDDVAAALAEEGVTVYAYKGESREDYYEFINKVIEFNPDITIAYDIDTSGSTTIKVFDITGREVETLFTGDNSVGHHQLTWKAENIPSGLYLIQLSVNGRTSVTKAVLMR